MPQIINMKKYLSWGTWLNVTPLHTCFFPTILCQGVVDKSVVTCLSWADRNTWVVCVAVFTLDSYEERSEFNTLSSGGVSE